MQRLILCLALCALINRLPSLPSLRAPGCDFFFKRYEFDNTSIGVTLWDTAGAGGLGQGEKRICALFWDLSGCNCTGVTGW